jgi:altronate hydrolase
VNNRIIPYGIHDTINFLFAFACYRIYKYLLMGIISITMAEAVQQQRICLQIHPDDNVLVALKNLSSGTLVSTKDHEMVLPQDVAAKHKIFVRNMNAGDDVIMYGVLVGKVQFALEAGSLMTTTNTLHAANTYAWRNKKFTWQLPDVSKFAGRTFNGYKRSDGRVGTANYWLFIPTVFCENRNLDVIREAMGNELGYAVTGKYRQFTRDLFRAFKEGEDISSINLNPSPASNDNHYFKNVDGIKFLNHQGGCGGTRQDAATLSALLAAYADHPNVGGVTVLSLGCQHLQVQDFLNDLKKRNPSFDKPLYIFEQQQTQSEEQLICDAIRQTFTGLATINKQTREPASLSKLCIGVKCGGSDGFSGISANPAVGYTSDLLVALGGKILLAEFPELCGAEQSLVDRCVDETVADKFIHLMHSYSQQAIKAGSGFHMNPSPGNIKDGLITDAIKSTGAARKGGTSPVVSVLDYTEPVVQNGLSLVCTPGNDVEATTGKAASGATLILFTTGLGTPTGNPVAPTIKIATNSSLARRMKDIIDIDTGTIITGEKTIESMGEEILEYCIKVAGGEVIPKAVQLAQDDFIPWKRGVSL